jgi:hypothetical protein
MFFVVFAGYNIIERGYLNMQGWIDYARQMEDKEKLVQNQNRVLRHANIDSVIMLTQTIEAKDPIQGDIVSA